MPHSTELLERIKTKLLLDYPIERYRYELELDLPEVKPKRMAPDLTIRDHDGRAVCLVEVGYTRPEKLRRYKELGAEVRWYSKDGELVDGYREVINVLRHVPSKLECFYYYLELEIFTCPKCVESVHDYLDQEHQDMTEDERWQEAEAEAESGTYTHCWISDNNRAIAVSFCDNCEHFQIHYSGVGSCLENPLLNLEFKNLSHFLYRQKKEPLDAADLLLSTLRQDFFVQWPLPPNKCSFERIEEFVKYWFDPEMTFQYELMREIEWCRS